MSGEGLYSSKTLKKKSSLNVYQQQFGETNFSVVIEQNLITKEHE